MFLSFFYHLRRYGLDVSLMEWLTLMESLKRGLIGPSFTDFYYLSRSILVKSETDFDLYDRAFYEFFKEVKRENVIPQELLKWLYEDTLLKDLRDVDPALLVNKDLDELLEILDERLKEQKEKHDGGNYYIGTGGTSTQGHSGYNLSGIRIGGKSLHGRALKVAEARHFKDFREDKALDIRQFQMAFRKLRQYSKRTKEDSDKIDVDLTCRKTSEKGGILTLCKEVPRKNAVKMLLLIDSNGSMLPHAKLVNRLFQAVSQANHYSDLKVYYFHNCIYDYLYKTPKIRREQWVETDWVFKNLSSDYKVVIVGDASMAPSELFMVGGNCILGMYNKETGISWLKKLKKKYPHTIWFNPVKEEEWQYVYGSATISEVKRVFPMYELTLMGLDKGIKKLLNK
ncbi:MAG: VWA containing CoxE family protein [Anaerovoracaceae bacterium]